MKKFVMCYLEVIEKFGLNVAAVYGNMENFSHMSKDGICNASQEKLATELKLSKRTVIRALKILESCFAILDTTPNLRNHTHSYLVTPVETFVSMVRTFVTPTVTDSTSHSDSVSHEYIESLKESVIDEKDSSLYLPASQSGKDFQDLSDSLSLPEENIIPESGVELLPDHLKLSSKDSEVPGEEPELVSEQECSGIDPHIPEEKATEKINLAYFLPEGFLTGLKSNKEEKTYATKSEFEAAVKAAHEAMLQAYK